jgi:hypothetical protein
MSSRSVAGAVAGRSSLAGPRRRAGADWLRAD